MRDMIKCNSDHLFLKNGFKHRAYWDNDFQEPANLNKTKNETFR